MTRADTKKKSLLLPPTLQVVKIIDFYVPGHFVITKLQQNKACCNLSFADLLQLVESTCSKPVDNQF